jgi:hypothetical protein
MVSLVLAAFVAVQVQVQAGASRDSAGRSVSVGVRVGASREDSVRRIPVTAEHIATAFRDAGARRLVTNARAAQFRQDSALRTYDAKVFQRVSVGMSLRATGRQRLVMRDEGVARVQWDHAHGAVVDLLGKRTTVPMDPDETGISEGVRYGSSLPIPYFPGRESLWIGASVARVEVDERSIVHPLREGAEAYYRYESGETLEYTLPNDQRITLRELRIEARKPHWNVIVGSFWFDEATAQLVRAVYRMSIEMDIWEIASEEAARDTTRGNEEVPGWVRGLISPMKASMSVFTIEYSLFEGRFWLPVTQGGEGRVQVSLLRVPLVFEERYVYASVNGSVDVAKPIADAPPLPPSLRPGEIRQLRDSLSKAGVSQAGIDSAVFMRRRGAPYRNDEERARALMLTRTRRDSLQRAGLSGRQLDSAVDALERIDRDSVRTARVRACEQTGSVLWRLQRYAEKVDVVLRTPCDLEALAKSPELPASAYDPGEAVFGTKERDELIGALDFGLQAGWGPQRILADWGFGQSRYNRVEGFSSGLALKQELGLGYAWNAQLRGSLGDKQANGELGIQRSNGRVTLSATVYRRLVSASDWGTPLTFSSSLPALLYARDEGFYYRAWGGELTRTTDRDGQLTLKLFAEEHRTAPVTTRYSVFGGNNDDRFLGNVESLRGTYFGGSARWQRSWGLAPRGLRTFADLRLEGAGGETEYGRGALDLTMSRGLFDPVIIGLTVAAGSSVGDVPPQRQWFIGGVHTVRGQLAGTGVGDGFWLTRLELARDRGAGRLSLYGDAGWAGSREGSWGRGERLLSGVGIGSSFLEGMIRFDLTRGLWPREKWRFDFSLEARF